MVALFLLLATCLLPANGALAQQPSDPALAAKIESLFHASISADDDTPQLDEAKRIYSDRGLPTIAEVGDLPSYEFVVLLASKELPLAFRTRISSQIEAAAARHELPADAAIFYAARLRLEKLQAAAKSQPPSNPALRDEIAQMYKLDQAVRQRQGFDPMKMEQADRAHAAPLQAMLEKYGVPTYSMVGPDAAGEFVVMIQHQPARFRAEVLPKLKANVEAGQADPESYALVYDRSLRDAGKPQFYGEQLECNSGEKMHEAPIDDAAHVNQRRAELGLIRVELYAQIAAEMMPQFCSQPQR